MVERSNYHKSTFSYLVLLTTSTSRTKQKLKDLKGLKLSWFPLKSQLVMCDNSYMIKKDFEL
jgi:hypothetical protein